MSGDGQPQGNEDGDQIARGRRRMTEGLARLKAWQRIVDPAFVPLLAAVEEAGSLDLKLLQRLRDRFPREMVEVALDLTAGRRKAAAKFPDAQRLVCDPEGVEQASAAPVAAHKAGRFTGAGEVFDLCCGIGGDTMALARVAPAVVAVDRSPLRSWMAATNAGVEAVTADIAAHPLPPGARVHLDPSRRRAGGRRLWSYAEYEPGPEILEPILDRVAGAAVKLGPGIDWRELPAGSGREIEFLGDGRSLSQAVMWCGDLCRAPGAHTATRLDPTGESRSFTAAPDFEVPVEERHGRYLFVPDPALERACLVGPRLGSREAAELAPGLGLLSGDVRLDDPWFEQHEIVASMPWREAKIRSWLRAHDGGDVVVRTRDGAVPTDTAQLALRGKGAATYVLFGLRLGRRVACYVTRPTVDPG